MEGFQGYKTDFAGRDGFTWWVGEVENIDDPSDLGRVKVRIIGWYTGANSNNGADSYTKTLPTENLPWATVLLPTDKPQTKNAGTTTELQPGAFVLGFFLDGEEAQLPVVMGSFRGFRQADDQKSASGSEKGAAETTKATTIADITNADKHQTNTPQQETLTGEKNFGGGPFVKDQTQTSATPQGGTEESRGAGLSSAEITTPGNSVTNPIKPPTESQEVANGAEGPGGGGFEKGLTRMLTELGTMTSSLATASDGQFISMITGHKVNGDKILEHLGNIANYISSAISAILAPLKEFLAQVMVKIVNAVVKAISKFVPIGVITAILSLIGMILDMFCMPHPAWLSLVSGALTNVTAFADQIVGAVSQKITNVVSTIASKVQGVTDKILGEISKAISKVRDVAATVVAGISAVKNAVENIGKIAGKLDKLFKVDFSNLDWGSLLGIIMAILGALFKKDCGRKIKKPKTKQWFPLIGSTDCENVTEFITGGAVPTSLKSWSESTGGSGTNQGSITTASGYIDSLFQGINTKVTQVQSFLDGSRIIHNATKGKEFFAEQGPGGVSNFQDNQGNIHTNVPNNQTKIISRDYAVTVKKNLIQTVEGDYHLKVHGNWHIEVEGAINNSQGNGPQAEASGSSKSDAASVSGDSGSSTSGGSSDSSSSSSDSSSSSSEMIRFSDLASYKSRIESLEERILREDEEFYSNLKPIIPDGAGRCSPPMKYSSLQTATTDDTEQRSGDRKSGDHDIAYSGDVRIQGNQVHIAAITNLKLNGNQIKIEANNITNSADGEIVNEAQWITSFLNCGRFEFIALFDAMSTLSGQYNIVKGAIVDVTTDQPGIGSVPAAQIRMSIANVVPTAFADIMTGGQPGVHFTFVSTPTGGIGEIVTCGSGAIINQTTTGLCSYGVNTGFAAFGCAVGPNQVYGLPLLLN
tara:strand:+ start:3481 stop:6261 length:2781 start_codon:yes stop_codon:yes gene_type:complete